MKKLALLVASAALVLIPSAADAGTKHDRGDKPAHSQRIDWD